MKVALLHLMIQHRVGLIWLQGLKPGTQPQMGGCANEDHHVLSAG